MRKQIAVIGLGRFGRSLATTLSKLGAEVLAVDTDPEKIQKRSPYSHGSRGSRRYQRVSIRRIRAKKL